ncbi:hypothetical protein M413DRAFT_444671 [Hebeloma cylindrosporum]|uniref:Uncharacterized protein n=1 Tax=Hebeloma cylindrosporum TaxID=76867 RepID=A0A0C3CF46_HEBCY|nr:hypothetical protein M413DRAFT_444671 [Hebeloma cylindrosporum h7]
MDENRRPGMAGVDNSNNNNNKGLYGNGISNNYVMDNDNYNDNYDNGSPHVDFKALAKKNKKKKSRAMNGSAAVLATRQHNVVDAGDFERDGGGAHGGGREEERAERNTNSLGVESQRLQLISPPPEEMLRRTSGQRTTANVPFTPSLLANPSPELGSGSTSKRKRTNTHHASASASTLTSGAAYASATTNNPQAIETQQPIEKTPNPKPRKQVRHARMPSMESPTRPSFGATPSTGSPGGSNGNNTSGSKNLTKEVNRTPTKPKRMLVQSPHARNPDADWIPEVPALALSVPPARRAVLSARGSRRSATPIPPYEPPPDVFTPPREVFLSPAVPTVSKSSKRKTPATKKKGARASTLRVVTIPHQVKQELPDHIDLSAPMPPPSPSDDPLLLSGPPEPESSPLRRLSRRHQREISVQVEMDDILPPSSPEPPLNSEDAETLRTLDWHRDAQMAGDTSEMDDSMMRLDPEDADVSPVRLFDFEGVHDAGDAGGWSDSDEEMGLKTVEEEVEEGEGEYTGKWTMTKVRTKLDPPSSATRVRMDAWGRPISPFPKIKKMDLLGEADEESNEEQEQAQAPVQYGDEEEEEEEVRRMSVEPEDPVDEDEEEEDEEEREVRQMSVEFDNEEEEEEQQELNLNIQDDSPPRQPSPAPTVIDRRSSNIFAFPSLESPEADTSTSKDVPRSPSAFASSNSVSIDEDTQMRDPPVQGQDLLDDDDEEDSSSDPEAELGIVKITSADPRAAARAAAILKQHDYDCYTKIVMKRRQSEAKQRRASNSALEDFAKDSRRRNLAPSGVSKSVGKNRRRSTLGMGVIGDRVFIPGTPVTTLPALLKEAELEVELEHEHLRETPGLASRLWSDRAQLEGTGQRDPFKTPSVDKHRSMAHKTTMSTISKNAISSHEGGEQPWTKEEWKYLDACFTDERLDLGAKLDGAEEGTMAPVDMVSVEAVVDRFVALMGGAEIVESFGDAWSRDNLVERAHALRRKQRSGHVARPSTPFTPLPISCSVASPSVLADPLGGKMRASRVEVPDFTPLVGRRAMPHPRKSRPSRPVLPPPVVHDAPFSNLPVDAEKERTSTTKRLPSTLLAPRYSHLLEEAIAISREGSLPQAFTPESGGEESSFASDSDSRSFEHSQDETSRDMDEREEDRSTILSTPVTIRPSGQEQPKTTVGNRVKGFLFSYLPTLSKPPSSLPSRKPQLPRQRGLPLPPPDILEKPRGPVTTPARPALPRVQAPKELVNLNPAPPLPSALPRPKAKPQRMVELHPLPPPIEKPIAPSFVRPRRSSGSSVKDLVRGFEEMENKEKERPTVKRVKSIGEMRAKVGSTDLRPKWKP